MIIACDSCGARFHLAEGRVGPRGAKVRCSSCHHRFHVGPVSKSAEGDPQPPSHEPAEPAESGPAASQRSRKLLGDPDLDNPRFLFDGGPDETGEVSTAPEGLTFQAGEVPHPFEITQLHDPAGQPDEKTTPASAGPARPLLEPAPPQPETSPDLVERSDTAPEPPTAWDLSSDDPFDFGRADDLGQEPAPERGREPAPPAAEAPAPEPPADLASATFAAADEEIDEAIERWDAPVARQATPVHRVEVLRPRTPPRSEQRGAVLRPARPARAASVRDVEASRPEAAATADPSTPAWLQGLVALVVAVLIVAAARLSVRDATTPLAISAPALGWSAEQVQARLARDPAGDPALEIHGALRGPTASALPRVEVILLDASGHTIGAGLEARTTSDSGGTGSDSEPLLRAGDAGGTRGSFALLIPEPPAGAGRFRIRLSAPVVPVPAPPSDSTTTAEPAGEPAVVTPAARSAVPGGTAPPAALAP